jgi:hypothetical protein
VAEKGSTVGFFDQLRQRRADKEAAEARARAREGREALETQRATLVDRIETASTFRGFDRDQLVEALGGLPTFQLKKDERVYLVASGAALVETRRGKGHYEGGNSGVSIRIARGMSYRVGASRGTFVQGEERPAVIDEDGEALITNQRVVFRGPKQSREWAFTKLLGYDRDLPGTITMQVSNRQKASGVVFGSAEDDAAFRLSLALADFNDDSEVLVDQLKAELVQLDADRVALAPPPPRA